VKQFGAAYHFESTANVLGIVPDRCASVVR